MSNSRNKKNKRGFTIIEMLVVLAIFAIMSSIVIFQYPTFQAQIDLKNTATDVALQIVQAQKDAVNGKLNTTKSVSNPWTPSYGVYFTNSSLASPILKDSFASYIDLNDTFTFDRVGCPSLANNDCLYNYSLSKGIKINSIKYLDESGNTITPIDFAINFTRPNFMPVFTVPYINNIISDIRYAEIVIKSPKGTYKYLCIYPSGRIQVNDAITCP